MKIGMNKLSLKNKLSRRDFFKYSGFLAGYYYTMPWLKGAKANTAFSPNPRVISVHDSNATNWDHVNGYHWEFINQEVVNNMVAIGVKTLTGADDLRDAWNILIPYQTGEVVVIKVNFNNSYDCSGATDNAMDAYPEMVNAVIDGLISIGVPPDKIWITDPSRGIPDRFINGIDNPDVHYYGGKFSNCSTNSHRTGYVDADSPDASPTTHPSGDVVRPAQVFVDAAHLINIPLLKGHGVGHMTLSMKNHYGSVTFSGSGPDSERMRMHQYLEPNLNPDLEKSILADICNNPHIRDKTRLVIGDGLFGHPIINWQAGGVVKWRCFNNNDPNILFFGTDFVATDSVMLDYIQEEQTRLGYGSITHSSLHHGASMGLGIHDHWDNFETKQYTLIDYIKIDFDVENIAPDSPSKNPMKFNLYDSYPNPFNNETLIKFSLDRSSQIKLNILNINGQRIKTITWGNYSSGIHSLRWDGRNHAGQYVASGIYLYQLKRGKQMITKRLILQK
jgi:uncharacterized protein (DUF362 family)